MLQPGVPALPRRVLFDTNVLLDVLLRREAFAVESARLWDAADRKAFQGVAVATALTTIGYLVGKAYDSARARADVGAVLDTFDVAAVSRLELVTAHRSGFVDYEDGVVHAAAVADGCDALVTRNGADFAASTLPVYTPAALPAALAGR